MSDSGDEPIASPAASSPARGANDDASDRASVDDAGSGDDLFGGDSDDGKGGDAGGGGGDDDDDGQLSDQPLSEHGLSDDDDNDNDDGIDHDDEDEGREGRGRRAAATREELVADVEIYRHRVPKPTDETLKSLRIPSFIKISPEAYDADAYVPTEEELAGSLGKQAPSVARFRRTPAGSGGGGALQSNSVVYRWSDGSVTLAIGDEHFEVLTKELAPQAGQAGKGKYDELQDAHYYAAAAHLSSNLLLTVGHVTEQFSVRANRSFADDALHKLADRLHAASQSTAKASANMIIRTVRDPELAKKEAELAEKERERAQRRRDAAAARMDGGVGGGGGGGGRAGGWSGGGALSINDLEGGTGSGSGSRRGAASGRKRGQSGAARPKRRRPDYDSDDELPQGARRNDEYDKGDDFIAPSDEDEDEDEGVEEDDDDDEEEEEDDEEDEDNGAAASSSRRTKRTKTDDDDVPVARRNRRHVLDDDDDDEE